MTEAHVESAISHVDLAQPSGQTHSRGPFSVFRIDGQVATSETTPEEVESPQDPAPVPTPDLFSDSWDFAPGSGVSLNEEFLANHDAGHRGDLTANTSGNPSAEEELMSTMGSVQTPYFPPISMEPLIHTPRASDFTDLHRAGQDRRTHHSDIPLEHLLFRPTFLTVQVKYLLDHYSNNVLHIFSILDNKDTPWRNFHLPRAYQCCTELEVVGKSSPARSALLHAILSVSAFHLQNKHMHLNQTETAMKWANIASTHRFQALDYLTTSAADPLTASTNSEYKELLAAMLSMVTVDVSR